MVLLWSAMSDYVTWWISGQFIVITNNQIVFAMSSNSSLKRNLSTTSRGTGYWLEIDLPVIPCGESPIIALLLTPWFDVNQLLFYNWPKTKEVSDIVFFFFFRKNKPNFVFCFIDIQSLSSRKINLSSLLAFPMTFVLKWNGININVLWTLVFWFTWSHSVFKCWKLLMHY